MNKTINQYQTIFILCIILLIGLYLRIDHLTYNSLWLDELFTINFSHPNNSFTEMLRLTLEDVHPPLYQTILWLWFNIFSVNEFNLRILSVIVGIFTIISSFFFSKLFFNKYISLSISFIFSSNIFLIFYSQEGRSYQLTVLFCILSFHYLYKRLIFQKKEDLILYWIVTILWMYTHYFSFFIIASQIVFVFIYIIYFAENKKEYLKIILFTAILFTISLLPLIPYILETTNNDSFWWMPKPSPLYFIDYIHLYFGYGGVFFVLFGLLTSIYFMLFSKKDKNEKLFLILISSWLILGFLLPYLNSIYNFSIIQIRYTIVLIPSIILLSAYGISKLNKYIQIFSIILFSIFTYKVLFIDHESKLYKQEYKKVIEFVNDHKEIPIYELIPENGHRGNNTNHFQVYANLLNYDLNIRNDFEFKQDYKDNKLPECFWLIYSYYSPELETKEDIFKINKLQIKENSIHLKFEKEYYRATALLYSSSKNTQCIKD